jgi:hypothetical protein
MNGGPNRGKFEPFVSGNDGMAISAGKHRNLTFYSFIIEFF